MASVTFDGVTKRYGGVTAVEDLDLEIRDGEFMVLLGPSGCGKSTALRMVAGLEEISAGDLSIGGQVVNQVVPAKRDVAMVFQSYALYPHMTVRKNIESPLVSKPSRTDDGSVRKLTKDERDARIDEAARMLDLADYLDRKPSALSGGQRQRVAVARAVVSRPAVFLMDEPLSNLDAKLRAQTRAEISDLHARLATTIVYVTHDQVEAMTMADRVAVLADGHIQQVGTPREVYATPANVFVAGFIGTPPMNIARGTAGSGRVEVDGGHLAISDADLTGDVLVGARPEHLLVDPEGPLLTTVRHVEWLGHEALATVGLGTDTDGARWTVRLEPDGTPPAEGDELRVRPVDGEVHLFHGSTGWRLGMPGAADARPSPLPPQAAVVPGTAAALGLAEPQDLAT